MLILVLFDVGQEIFTSIYDVLLHGFFNSVSLEENQAILLEEVLQFGWPNFEIFGVLIQLHLAGNQRLLKWKQILVDGIFMVQMSLLGYFEVLLDFFQTVVDLKVVLQELHVLFATF